MNCPCQSGQFYDQCCGRFITHRALPENAEELMRSRYSAFHQAERDYLLESWHPDYRPVELDFNDDTRWLALQVLRFEQTDQTATVEFEARLLSHGRVELLHELSSFVFQQGRWFYTDGKRLQPTRKPWQPARNESCPCGSGSKFKRCCMTA